MVVVGVAAELDAKMGWIKIDTTTPDKPEVYQIARILGISRAEVMGCLLYLWIWADRHSISGHDFVTHESDIDEIVRKENFGKAMREVGWLKGDEGAVTIPNFSRHNGKSAKKRAQWAKRQARKRHANVTPPSPSKSDKSVTKNKIKIKNKETTTNSVSSSKESAVPVDFFITDKMRMWAAEKVPSVDIETETAGFLDHHTARGTRFKDWEAAWRQWMRNAVKFSQRPLIARETASDRNVRNLRESLARLAAPEDHRADNPESPALLLTSGSNPRRD